MLAEKGIDVEATSMAWSSEEGVDVEFGVLATTGRRVFQFLLVEGALVEWNDLTDRWKSTPYADEIRTALVAIRPPRPPRSARPDRPEGTEIRLEMPHRGGHISLWWDGPPTDRRVAFWFGGVRMRIYRSVIQFHNGKRWSRDELDLRDMDEGELLRHLPPRPIQLRPKPRRGGLAQLAELHDPAAYQTNQWVLSGGASARGVIYNSTITSNVKVRVELDLDLMVVWYFEETDLDDG